MEAFGYLSVLISIIIGLAITQILAGFRGIVLWRSHVRMYWPVPVWAGTLLLVNVQSWWAMFSLREVATWSFAAFAVVLAQATVQYLLAAIVFPDFSGDTGTNLREHYWTHTHWFFGLFIALLVCSLGKTLTLTGHLPAHEDLVFHLVFIALSASALASRRDGWHKTLALLGPFVMLAYVVALFARLR